MTAARARTLRTLAAAGVLAAALIAVCVNILAARFYRRWDCTSARLYTLSPATVETLRGLGQPLEVIVLLSRSDPLTATVRQLLTAYGGESQKLTARFVDPDAAPAELLAVQQKYGILAGKTEDGRLVTDAAIVVASPTRHWFITSDELVAYDEHAGRTRPQLEQALTSALRNVVDQEPVRVCFTAGHGEYHLDSGGPQGLAELRARLEKNNYRVEAVELGAAARLPPLAGCRVVVLAGPEQTFSEAAARHLASYFETGGNLLLLVGPILGESERIEPTGLDPVLRLAGLQFDDDLVVEVDPNLRLASGSGEAYFATPREHAVTRGLVQGSEVTVRPVLSVSQSLHALAGGAATVLLTTSAAAYGVRDVRGFAAGKPPAPADAAVRGPLTVAMAAELHRIPGSPVPHGPRLVAVGSPNFAWSGNYADATARGNRLFVESAVSWLAARPALVSVPEKPTQEAGLGLTEQSLGEVMRYVLFYLPGSAAALGLFVMLRRRGGERRARRAHRDEGPS